MTTHYLLIDDLDLDLLVFGPYPTEDAAILAFMESPAHLPFDNVRVALEPPPGTWVNAPNLLPRR